MSCHPLSLRHPPCEPKASGSKLVAVDASGRQEKALEQSRNVILIQ